jgi:hypothetical protein
MNNQVSDTSSGEPLVYRAIVEIAYYKCDFFLWKENFTKNIF